VLRILEEGAGVVQPLVEEETVEVDREIVVVGALAGATPTGFAWCQRFSPRQARRRSLCEAWPARPERLAAKIAMKSPMSDPSRR
jgi:hypothetical protein